MGRTVSIFFTRDVTGFSEPGTCPRCKRSVNVGSKGGTKAHKCHHGDWCSSGNVCIKCAVAKSFRDTSAHSDDLDRAETEPHIVAAGKATDRAIAKLRGGK